MYIFSMEYNDRYNYIPLARNLRISEFLLYSVLDNLGEIKSIDQKLSKYYRSQVISGRIYFVSQNGHII